MDCGREFPQDTSIHFIQLVTEKEFFPGGKVIAIIVSCSLRFMTGSW